MKTLIPLDSDTLSRVHGGIKKPDNCAEYAGHVGAAALGAYVNTPERPSPHFTDRHMRTILREYQAAGLAACKKARKLGVPTPWAQIVVD